MLAHNSGEAMVPSRLDEAKNLDVVCDHSDSSSLEDDNGMISDQDSVSYAVSNASEPAQEADAPEQLVRREDLQVKSLSLIVLLLLVAVATATSTAIYIFTKQSEVSAYEREFESVGLNVVEKLLYDCSHRMNLAHGFAETAMQALEDRNTTAAALSFESRRMATNTRPSRRAGNFIQLAWNPFIFDDEQRQEMEMSVLDASLEIVNTTNPPCFPCGDPSLGFINRDAIIQNRPGQAPTSCGIIDDEARVGAYRTRRCDNVPTLVNGTCICGPVPPEAAEPIDLGLLEEVPKELYEVDEGTGEPRALTTVDYPHLVLRQLEVPGLLATPALWVQDSEPDRKVAIHSMLKYIRPVFSSVIHRTSAYYNLFGGWMNRPSLVMYYPVHTQIVEDGPDEVVGAVSLEVLWDRFVTGVLPPGSQNVDIVLESSCDGNYTFSVDPTLIGLIYRGEGDLHETQFDGKSISSSFQEFYDLAIRTSPGTGRFEDTTEASQDESQEGDEAINEEGIPDASRLRKRVLQTADDLNDGDVDQIEEEVLFDPLIDEPDYCLFRFVVYPTSKLKNEYISVKPIVYTIIAACIFIFTSLVFITYDMVVRRRQANVMASAKRTNDIVTSLFPQSVRDRIYQRSNTGKSGESTDKKSTFLSAHAEEDVAIADFFPRTTVMFLDIAGFTAWSSEREPHQVFRLLESIYGAFDEVASRMRVFKVETIGDSYVAVCGLPKPNERHAIVMTKFAYECLRKLSRLTQDLVGSLGPSTGQLAARVGLHSGPVTAGVLRGEKARFQLFGDTVNTAARMESSGHPYRIHASKATAELLIKSGKEQWVVAREDRVALKGKGEMETFWLNPQMKTSSKYAESARSSRTSTSTSDNNDFCLDGSDLQQPEDKLVSDCATAKKNVQRLVEWNVEVLSTMLENVVHHRETGAAQGAFLNPLTTPNMVIEEVVDVLEMPPLRIGPTKHVERQTLDPLVRSELSDFVSTIAELYKNVPFHNFEHASHVLMSANKLLKRIINPDGIDHSQSDEAVASQIYDRTYGISADPLMQFAMVFAALIHDVDHSGLTNAELIAAGAPLAEAYRNRAIAEQNSVDVAWTVLCDKDRFQNLRSVLFVSENEKHRFRQLVVNAVIATDIADKDLKACRERRWNRAFPADAPEAASSLITESSTSSTVRQKATIVYEYIIQAADVAHTMQHWHTYQRNNSRLFEERYIAWVNNRSGAKDPSQGWYAGELWFFDNYIIPLARKLEACGVFGVSYDECLNYALQNRREWEQKGEGIVEKLLEECQEKHS